MSTYPARLKTSRRLLRLFPWVSGLVLVAGLVAFLIVFYGNTAKQQDVNPAPGFKPTVVKPTAGKSVPVPRESRVVAGRFILTAVQRKHLEQAWPLIGPAIRQGLTHKQWLTGNIAVVPWFGQLGQVPLKVDYSIKNEVEFTVILAPKVGTKGHPDTFIITLHKFGNKWLVTSWVPFEPPPIKANPVG
ncbi:MAG: hypothetical protein E6G42_03375 [Actinobacteria bacterium]|nr:MAG: hypothetical protein E6G42_03375 [Actinomycetota bacterium]